MLVLNNKLLDLICEETTTRKKRVNIDIVNNKQRANLGIRQKYSNIWGSNSTGFITKKGEI